MSQDLTQFVNSLGPLEREELFTLLYGRMFSPSASSAGTAPPTYPSIVATPEICGGSARIIRTRIPVWTIERMRQKGISDGDILRSFPTLRAMDLVQAWSYADQHRTEIEQDIRENEE